MKGLLNEHKIVKLGFRNMVEALSASAFCFSILF